MSLISQYLIKVICAAVFSGILNHIMKGKSALSAIIKTISGIFVSVTVLSPLINMRLYGKYDVLLDYFETGSIYSAEGDRIATEQESEFIKSMTQSYILDKAASLGAELEVEVVLTGEEDNPYKKVMLQGDISPYVKAQLSQIITEELGIPKESQKWIS